MPNKCHKILLHNNYNNIAVLGALWALDKEVLCQNPGRNNFIKIIEVGSGLGVLGCTPEVNFFTLVLIVQRVL